MVRCVRLARLNAGSGWPSASVNRGSDGQCTYLAPVLFYHSTWWPAFMSPRHILHVPGYSAVIFRVTSSLPGGRGRSYAVTTHPISTSSQALDRAVRGQQRGVLGTFVLVG